MAGSIQRLGRNRLAKPDDAGAQKAAAARTPRSRCVHIAVRDHTVFRKTAIFEQVPVKLDNFLAAGTLVQTVYILGNERQAGNQAGKLCQRIMTGIGLDPGDEFPAPLIPAPD